jgi:hypothetical protein
LFSPNSMISSLNSLHFKIKFVSHLLLSLISYPIWSPVLEPSFILLKCKSCLLMKDETAAWSLFLLHHYIYIFFAIPSVFLLIKQYFSLSFLKYQLGYKVCNFILLNYATTVSTIAILFCTSFMMITLCISWSFLWYLLWWLLFVIILWLLLVWLSFLFDLCQKGKEMQQT